MSRAVANRLRAKCKCCIDFHAHFLHPEVFDRCTSHSVSTGFGRQPLPTDSPIFRKLLDPDLQLRDMDERGVDVAVISSAEVLQGRSWAGVEEDRRLSALTNDLAATWANRFPKRFVSSFVLPLGNIAMAIKELERCVSMGARVVNLPSNYQGDYLGHARYSDLWSVIAEKGLVAFIHPDGIKDPWFQDYVMWNSIGQSIEEVKVMTSLIYEGVMERLPSLKVVMAHGGGYMPHYMGRLDRNAAERPFTMKNLSKKPSEYLRNFYYDSCVFDPRTLELLIERVGADRIVLGGDYPVAAVDPIDFLDTAMSLDDTQRALIAGGNALQLLGIAFESLSPEGVFPI